MAQWLGWWTQESRAVGSFLSLDSFIYPQFASVYSAVNEHQGCWKVPAMD